jgi:hypothetical protein
LTFLTVALGGCQTDSAGGSLAQIKREQESRLMFACVGQYGTAIHGGITIELIQACKADADARVW